MKWLSRKEEEILWAEKNKSKVTCKCGHVNIIMNKKGYHLCSWCHDLVFKDKQTEFKFRMKENLLKEKRNMK